MSVFLIFSNVVYVQNGLQFDHTLHVSSNFFFSKKIIPVCRSRSKRTRVHVSTGNKNQRMLRAWIRGTRRVKRSKRVRSYGYCYVHCPGRRNPNVTWNEFHNVRRSGVYIKQFAGACACACVCFFPHEYRQRNITHSANTRKRVIWNVTRWNGSRQ